ncbi:MAG: 4a-hydroxytetrahydrobiopterin dehydratase [Brachymonas sp.]|nr:4a-hydroxytetrahydrobiopterin dehydratase [Brachymonas sp.]
MSDLKKKQWVAVARRALSATEIVANLVELQGWMLDGDGEQVAIQKTFKFVNYLETMSFVNAIAFIAERHDHHPDMSVHFNRCVVRFNTHDVNGISITDIECAAEVDALVKPR